MSRAVTVLRDKLLSGRSIALAGGARPVLVRMLEDLGAEVKALDEAALGEQAAAERWAQEHLPLHALVHDASGAFGQGGGDHLKVVLEEAWAAIRAVAAEALIPEGVGGKIVLLGPPAQAGAYAQAARSALENTCRTLAVEWARYGITTTMVAPGEATTEEQIATLVCFVLSRAGDYLSGCRVDLGAAADS